MPAANVFTVRALSSCLDRSQDAVWLFNTDHATAKFDSDLGVGVASSGSATFWIHPEDDETSARIVIMNQSGADPFAQNLKPVAKDLLQRIHTYSRLSIDHPHRMPTVNPAWSPYRSRSLISIFACHRERTPHSERMIIESRVDGSDDVCMWAITSKDKQIDLDTFTPAHNIYEQAVSGWSTAYSQLRTAFDSVTTVGETGGPEIQFGSATFGEGTKRRSYSGWLKELTQEQRSFVESDSDHSVKLRGPAGSGKTLALEMKALKEVQGAWSTEKELRILFITHSWSMAGQIDSDLNAISEWGELPEIQVYPLLAVVQDILPHDRQQADLHLIGEDSWEGKQLQLERLDELWAAFVESDWLTFRDSASPEFRERVESAEPNDRKGLVWDTLMEFGCVLGADGIFPGRLDAEPRYLRLPRASWMMPLTTEGDRRAILYLYRRYGEQLRADGRLTSDELINDFLIYLMSFAWDHRRKTDGYDLIFVDELHLFNTQERLILRYLTRDTSTYPLIFMALDPRQSPWIVYSGFGALATDPSESDSIDDAMGQVSAVDLPTVHRFTPEILDLVKDIWYQIPTMDHGPDWKLDFDTVSSAAPSGPIPTVVECGTPDAELVEAFQRAEDAGKRRTGVSSGSTAVVVVDPRKFPTYKEVAVGWGQRQRGGVQVIASRDDVMNLRHAGRGLVVGVADFVSGLQFGSVIIAGLPAASRAPTGHGESEFLRRLYLAISRAEVNVEIIVNSEDGGIPDVLQSALERKKLKLERGRQV